MKLIVCLDDKNGMLFMKKRQSRDRLLIEDIGKHTTGETVLMEAYSLPLFDGSGIPCRVSDDPLTDAIPDGVCFNERFRAAPHKDAIDTVILYRWNRHYPGDFFFDLDLSDYTRESVYEFPGSSHDKITREIYKRNLK